MANEGRNPIDPHAWLARAKSNLERAKADARLNDVFFEDLCFDAQQAAEKAIKAALIHRGLAFPYVHDLRKLLNLLSDSGLEIPPEVKDAAYLTEYATTSRYPGPIESVTEEEYHRAVQISEIVYKWAIGLIDKNA